MYPWCLWARLNGEWQALSVYATYQEAVDEILLIHSGRTYINRYTKFRITFWSK